MQQFIVKSIVRNVMLIIVLLVCATPKASGVSFALDSIATWGRFPRFCVNTYRWGDRFFNSYDSTYVQGSGKRFNVKTKVDSWTDAYNFRFENDYRMEMLSHPSTTMGFYLTYMAVSMGYDMNIGKYFNGGLQARKRFNLQFNCSLFALEYYTLSNDIGTNISRITAPGQSRRVNIDFQGINTSMWGIDLYYFFNHKHYSQAAAYYYSKIQVKSSGSLFAGLSIWGQHYSFDFWDLTKEPEFPQLPYSWGYLYDVKNKNIAVKFGYAYNWVFHPGWCMGLSESPTAGVRRGYVNTPGHDDTSFVMSNIARFSVVYNHHKKWFFGVVGRADTGIIYDNEHTLLTNNLSVEVSAGFRFDFKK